MAVKKRKPARLSDAETPPLPDEPLLLECLYTPEQAGRYIRASERQVIRRLNTGAIGHVMVGHTRYISGRQIADFIAENSREPLPPDVRPRLTER